MCEGKEMNKEIETFVSLVTSLMGPRSICIDRTKCDNGLVVSTVNTSDMGMETAIISDGGAHPVERYGYDEIGDAKEGHKKWVAFCNQEGEKKIVKLGYGCVGSREVILKMGGRKV